MSNGSKELNLSSQQSGSNDSNMDREAAVERLRREKMELMEKMAALQKQLTDAVKHSIDVDKQLMECGATAEITREIIEKEEEEEVRREWLKENMLILVDTFSLLENEDDLPETSASLQEDESSCSENEDVSCASSKDTEECLKSDMECLEPGYSIILNPAELNDKTKMSSARCNKTFSCVSSLNRHRNVHGKKSSKPTLECPYEGCKRTFSSVSTLYRHKVSVHGKKLSNQTLECPYEGCKRTFSCASLLNRHRNAHEKKLSKQKLECPFEGCNRTFSSVSILYRHKISDHGKKLSKQMLECPYEGCNRTFSYARILHRHKVSVHGEKLSKQMLECPFEGCNRTFSSVSSLYKHKIRVHGKTLLLECPYESCRRKFSCATLLRGHRENVHEKKLSKPTFECPYEGCQRKFSFRSLLRRHEESVHEKKLPKPTLECPYEGCQRNFSFASLLRRHKNVHERKLSKPTLECPYEGCKRTFLCASALKSHKRMDHDGTCRKFHKSKLKCPFDECCSEFERYQPLREHLGTVHGLDNSCEEFVFDSEEDFELWRNQIQDESNVEYVKRFRPALNADGSWTTHLYCSRSYESRATKNEDRLRAMKFIGSRKIGKICPSSIQVTRRVLENNRNQIKVKFWKNHFGHTFDLGHLTIPEKDKKEIARKLMNGKTFSEILEAIGRPDNEETQWSKRTRLLKRQDLHNIIKQYKLSAPTSETPPTQDDRLSVKMWVAEMEQKLPEANPVLLFKEQGQRSLLHFDINDFALGIMSDSFQKEEHISKLGSSKICIDSIHGTNACEISLHTLLTVDEFGSVVPVAYFFCNKSEESAFKIFFEHVKQKLGPINCSVFMSDDVDALYRAWMAVMGPVESRLLCTWHVDQCWKRNFAKIKWKNREKKKQVYKTLRTLMTTHEGDFKTLLSKSIALLLEDEDTRNFGEYFIKTYASRPESWAHFHRKRLGIKTNKYLESVHKSLRNIYLEGKRAKQIVRTICALMRFRPTRDCVLKKPKETNPLASKVTTLSPLSTYVDETSSTSNLCAEEDERFQPPTEAQDPLVAENHFFQLLLGTSDPAKERLKEKLKLALALVERESENVSGQKSSTIEENLDAILNQLK